MMGKDLKTLWECADCKNVEYGDFPPEECRKCWKANSFVEVSEEMAEQMKDKVLDFIRKDDGDNDLDDEVLG